MVLHLLSGMAVEAVELDHRGNLWIGTSEGLERYAGGTLVALPGKQPVTALHADAHDGMWVGTAGGMLHVSSEGAPLPLQANGWR